MYIDYINKIAKISFIVNIKFEYHWAFNNFESHISQHKLMQIFENMNFQSFIYESIIWAYHILFIVMLKYSPLIS